MQRRITISLVFLFVVGLFSQAQALDGYRDRKGLFTGLHLGGASAKSDFAGAKSHIGYVIGGKIGGGVNQNLTLDGSLSMRFESYDEAQISVSTQTTTMYLGVNYFVKDGLYLRGMGGIAQASSEAGGTDNSETGLGFGAGLGYEFFASAQLAVGVGGEFQMLQFDDASVTVINFGISANWY
jgi:hypothetical protein